MARRQGHESRRGAVQADLLLPQVRAFVAIAELRSYARAAEQLSYSEPGVYLQVKGLERTLGVPLVKRAGKQVLLSSEGAAVLDAARALLNDAAFLIQATRALRGKIVVAAGLNTAVSLLLPSIAHFEATHPGVTVELHNVHGLKLIEGVIDGEVDVAIGSVSAASEALLARSQTVLRSVPFLHDDWALFGSVQARDFARSYGHQPIPVYHMSEFTEERLRYFQGEIERALEHPVRLSAIDGLELVRGMIVNGLGLGILPVSARRAFARDAQLVCPLGEPGRITLRILHRRGKAITPPVREFVSTIARARHHLKACMG